MKTKVLRAGTMRKYCPGYLQQQHGRGVVLDARLQTAFLSTLTLDLLVRQARPTISCSFGLMAGTLNESTQQGLQMARDVLFVPQLATSIPGQACSDSF